MNTAAELASRLPEGCTSGSPKASWSALMFRFESTGMRVYKKQKELCTYCTFRLETRTLPVHVGIDPGNCHRSPVSGPEGKSEDPTGCAFGFRGRHSARRTSMPFQRLRAHIEDGVFRGEGERFKESQETGRFKRGPNQILVSLRVIVQNHLRNAMSLIPRGDDRRRARNLG